MGLLLALGWVVLSVQPIWPCFFLGLTGGLINAAPAQHQAAVPADARGNTMAISNAAGYLAMTGFAALFARPKAAGMGDNRQVSSPSSPGGLQRRSLKRVLLREAFELAGEPSFGSFIMVRGVGPDRCWPGRGPVLIVAKSRSAGSIRSSRQDPVGRSRPDDERLYDKPILSWFSCAGSSARFAWNTHVSTGST